jgi:4a-hydroxytetrahydrobiopterin dehydratase
MTKVDDGRVREALAKLPGWERAGEAIEKTYRFKNYYETIAFVNAVAWVSHAADHHPDLEVGYNRCKVRYTTHDAGGLSERDLQCAARIESQMEIR